MSAASLGAVGKLIGARADGFALLGPWVSNYLSRWLSQTSLRAK
jgi:hypothetical protein